MARNETPEIHYGKVRWLEFLHIDRIRNKNGEATHQQIHLLSKIIEDFDTRLNIFIGTILNLFLFWDFRDDNRYCYNN